MQTGKPFRLVLCHLTANFWSLFSRASILLFKEILNKYEIHHEMKKDLNKLSSAAAFMADAMADCIQHSALTMATDMAVHHYLATELESQHSFSCQGGWSSLSRGNAAQWGPESTAGRRARGTFFLPGTAPANSPSGPTIIFKAPDTSLQPLLQVPATIFRELPGSS